MCEGQLQNFLCKPVIITKSACFVRVHQGAATHCSTLQHTATHRNTFPKAVRIMRISVYVPVLECMCVCVCVYTEFLCLRSLQMLQYLGAAQRPSL